MIDAIAREEFDRIVERMNVPSGAYAFMVIIDQPAPPSRTTIPKLRLVEGARGSRRANGLGRVPR